jgi:predicted unusual protein kinase regulating ubiquinone biosynthesis (AarF/ABC1/UbiB family)
MAGGEKPSPRKTDDISGGRLRRTVPLVALTTRTAGEAVVVGLRSKLTGADSADFHIRTAERYAQLLGRSKGALMKAGQMLSFMALGSAFGEFQTTYQTALDRLRDDAPPMVPELAVEVLEHEFGCSLEDAFAEFSPQPLASASIGQVHAARLHDGRRVAVKIQYPGVAAAIRADLQNTELLATLLSLISGLSPRRLSIDLRGAAHEIGERIVEELDYGQEARNQAEFAELYKGHPFIRIPAPIGELCTARVLTQELAQGLRWGEALKADQAVRNSWAEAIHRFHYGSYHYFHLFNADPHPGNYLFQEDGGVSFLDFGCVKRLDSEQVTSLNAVMRECLRGAVEQTWRVSIEGGFFEPSGSLTATEVFDYWRQPVEMYWGAQPFTVTPEYVTKLIELRYSPTGPFANAFRHLAAPVAYTIMSRIEIGVLSLIAQLRSTNEWQAIAAEYFEDAPPITPMGKLDRVHRDRLRKAVNNA